ncbi:MAG: hypothetical protein HQM08_13315 [Candidatus Riflebacteria bacterium]|nr:hypothetical protein [Candidatus Riflebacteria bacterium]
MYKTPILSDFLGKSWRFRWFQLGRSQAFTLVELLVGMLLFILVGGVLYMVQSSGMRAATKGTTRLTMQSESRRKLELMVLDLRCANEILDISESSIRFTRYGQVDEEGAIGDETLKTIHYYLQKTGTQWAFFREVGKEEPKKMLQYDNIEPEIFFPYHELDPEKEHSDLLFLPFDFKTNDSGFKKRITFIRIILKLRQGREFTSISTSVTLRPAHSKLLQTGWRFR